MPVAIDGEQLGLVELIGRAAALAGAHGVGRIDMIENRLVGIKIREVYETPAAALLMAAYAGVEELVCERDLAHVKAELAGALRDARLQRPLVLAASRGDGRLHGHDRRRRHRHGAGAPLSRLAARSSGGGRLVALRPRPRHVRAGRQLPARGCRRVHPRVVAAHQDVGRGRGGRRRDGARVTHRALGRSAGRRPRPRRAGLHGLARGRPAPAAVRPASDGGARAHARAPGPDPGPESAS